MIFGLLRGPHLLSTGPTQLNEAPANSFSWLLFRCFQHVPAIFFYNWSKNKKIAPNHKAALAQNCKVTNIWRNPYIDRDISVSNNWDWPRQLVFQLDCRQLLHKTSQAHSAFLIPGVIPSWNRTAQLVTLSLTDWVSQWVTHLLISASSRHCTLHAQCPRCQVGCSCSKNLPAITAWGLYAPVDTIWSIPKYSFSNY